jgi:hypothetical protein
MIFDLRFLIFDLRDGEGASHESARIGTNYLGPRDCAEENLNRRIRLEGGGTGFLNKETESTEGGGGH